MSCLPLYADPRVSEIVPEWVNENVKLSGLLVGVENWCD